jgi:hypothetical protein
MDYLKAKRKDKYVIPYKYVQEYGMMLEKYPKSAVCILWLSISEEPITTLAKDTIDRRTKYIESPAMRGLLRRLKCDNYKTPRCRFSIIPEGPEWYDA